LNTMLLIPEPNEPSTGLMHATFTQFLSPRFGVTAGKIYTLDAPGEFAGDYRTQFLNAGAVSTATSATIWSPQCRSAPEIVDYGGSIAHQAAGFRVPTKNENRRHPVL